MALSVRLESSSENKLRQHLAATGGSLSEFVRSAIEDKLEQAESESSRSAYELGKSVFGLHSSGVSSNSQNRKQLIREKVHAGRRR